MATKQTTTNQTGKGTSGTSRKLSIAKYKGVVAALKQGKAAAWSLAEALAAEVAPGMKVARKADYDDLVQRLQANKVPVSVSPTTMRIWRQAARYWCPADGKDLRVPDLPISHHVQAMGFSDNPADTRKWLDQLILDQGGNVALVTMSVVKQAMAQAPAKSKRQAATRAAHAAKAAAKGGGGNGNTATAPTATVTGGDVDTLAPLDRLVNTQRVMSQARLADMTTADLAKAHKSTADLLARIESVQAKQAAQATRAAAPAKQVGKAAPATAPAAKQAKQAAPAKQAKRPTGVR